MRAISDGGPTTVTQVVQAQPDVGRGHAHLIAPLEASERRAPALGAGQPPRGSAVAWRFFTSATTIVIPARSGSGDAGGRSRHLAIISATIMPSTPIG